MTATRFPFVVTRRTFIWCAAGLSTAALLGGCAVPSATTKRPRRIGGLFAGFTRDGGATIRDALANIGYVDGRDVVFEFRYAENFPERLPLLAAELVELPVDILITSGGANPVIAAKGATTSIPIVFTGVGDPVGNGLVPSLAHPGGNVTGVGGVSELAGKRLEFLAAMAPGISRVAISYEPVNAASVRSLGAAETFATRLDMRVVPIAAQSVDEFIVGLGAAERGIDAIQVQHGATFFGPALQRVGELLDFAVQRRLPQIFNDVLFVKAGGLMSLGDNTTARWRAMADLIDKIFTGASAGDLPVSETSLFELALNPTMARKIGLTIPPSVLREATQVINA